LRLVTENFFDKCEGSLIRTLASGVVSGKITMIECSIVIESFRLGRSDLIDKYDLGKRLSEIEKEK